MAFLWRSNATVPPAVKDRNELIRMIEQAAKSQVIDWETQKMLLGVMNIASLRVRDLMVPRSQVTMIPVGMPIEEILEVMQETAHSRYPVLDEGAQEVTGVLLAKDCLQLIQAEHLPKDLSGFIRPAVVVPESHRIDRMLTVFRSGGSHLAVVMDEFGSISGVITIEDVLEQIVGEIEDEYDAEDELIQSIDDRTFIVCGTTPLERFNKQFKTKCSCAEADSIGGWLLTQLHRIPTLEEKFPLPPLELKILKADARRIETIQVCLPSTANIDTKAQAKPGQENAN